MGFITEEQDEQGTGSKGLGRRARIENNEEAEITLGMRSLLGIFFGLVLICGIFFGLGYSVGRSGGARVASEENSSANPATNANLKKPSAEQGLTPVPEPAPVAEETRANPPAETEQAAAPAPAASESKPAAVTTPAPAPKPVVAAAQPITPPARPQVAQTTQPATVPARPQVATNQPAPARPQAFTPQQPASSAPPQAQSVAAAAPSSGYVVQIAAVRLPADASVLVTALNRRGYHAIVRNESTDALLHVQVGPFTTRADAYNMRAKLLADGYNAVVK